MNHVNKYLRNFQPYKVASHKVWTVEKAERKNILKLDWNESTVPPSPLVKEKLSKLVEDGDFFNLYPSTKNDRLYELLSKYVGVPTKNIQYFGSSDALHEYIAKLFISVGDPVVILWPSYDNFRLTAEVSGGRIFYFNFNIDFSFDSQEFKKFIADTEASLVYICNPNNPLGYLHPVSLIKELLEEFPETMFLVDEAYFEFTDPKTTAVQLTLDHENLLVSRTMSKAFGIANFRFGYLVANEKNINYISTIRNPKNITTFAQEAAIAVLEDVEYMESVVKEVNLAKREFLENLKPFETIQAYPSESNFVLLRFSSYEEKMDLLTYLTENNIFIRNVDQSPLVHNCLRISIGTREQMRRVIRSVRAFYGK